MYLKYCGVPPHSAQRQPPHPSVSQSCKKPVLAPMATTVIDTALFLMILLRMANQER